MVATLFVGLIPWAALIWMRLRGQVTDVHVTQRQQRWPILLITLISILGGIAVLLAVSAPGQIIAEVLFMLAGLVIVGIVNLAWKLSIHAALATFAALHCLLALPAGAQIAVVIIALVGWARIRSGHHTPTQVMAGTLIGVLVSLGDLLVV
ncbi:phosphoesterase PA-phosphatase [Arthrobacter sp. MYb211]|nr:phosphoesterase PA-phosphatase [Arthrobacter sp. MYb224]PRA06733.1 phosphoesterase PA-phosphatase [Arthrobacter sp. MYb229]PRB53634.1 phosphoesterase PA-phosphatase [Arthrobacter sp. MYb216]PRC09243.1 phosphoesterase PA-phosphatase [Arthrobacter sp. MYb211]